MTEKIRPVGRDFETLLLNGNEATGRPFRRVFEIVKNELNKKRQFSVLSSLVRRIMPQIPLSYEIMKMGEAYLSYWNLTINLPFQFHEEKKLVKWIEEIKENKSVREELNISYIRTNTTTGTYWGKQNDEYGDFPYATRTYTIWFEGKGHKHMDIVFDSRLEGATCAVIELEKPIQKDAVYEIVCEAAVEANDFI